MNLDVEARILHMGIDLLSSIPLTELDALAVALHDFENELQDRDGAARGLS